jgi:drug/metabolite transporter (DMT)-like permease
VIKGLVFSVSAAFAFGLLAIMVKLSYQAGLGTMALLQYRWLTGAAILFVYLLIRDRTLLRANRATLLKAFLLGAVGHGLGSTCFFKSLAYIPASSSTLILYFYPAVVTLLSVIFFRMKAGRIVLLSLALVSGGCGLVFYDAFLKALDIRGILFAAATMLTFSCSLIAMQIFLRGERFLTLNFYMVLFTGLIFVPFSNPLLIADLNARQILLCLSLGLIPTAFAYVFLFRAIETVGSGYTAIFSTFEPVTTVVMAWLVLHEDIVPYQIAGMLLIIAGIILPNLRKLEPLKNWKAGRGGGGILKS